MNAMACIARDRIARIGATAVSGLLKTVPRRALKMSTWSQCRCLASRYSAVWSRPLQPGNVHRKQRAWLSSVASEMETTPDTPPKLEDSEDLAEAATAVKKKLFVRGIPADWKEDMVKETFGKFGSIIEVQVTRSERAAKENATGACFVVFQDEANAKKAAAEMEGKVMKNGQPPLKIKLQSYFKPNDSESTSNKFSVFCTGLDVDLQIFRDLTSPADNSQTLSEIWDLRFKEKIRPKDLRGLFEELGLKQEIDIQIINEDHAIKRNKCLAILSFETMESAISAMKKLNGRFLKSSKIEVNPKNFEMPDETVEPPKPKAAASQQPQAAGQAPSGKDAKQASVASSSSASPPPVQAFPQPKVSGRQSKKVKTQDSKVVELTPGITIKALAEAMGVRVVDALKSIIKMGEEPKTIQDEVNIDIAELVVLEHGMQVKLPEGSESMVLGRTFTNEEYQKLDLRAPVVTIMGHVDHGKTTLLDYLRSTSVAAGEVGGITQSIAAFEVHRPKLGKICFIDTPGHQAFSSMRERGARATDIIVLVIAAEDGVMPQTIEVIDHARAAQVPLIIAVNKCDLPDADPHMVYSQLMEHGVTVEAFGGDVQTVNISALKGQGIEKLEEAIMLLAEMMDLRAPKDGPAEGIIIESRKDKALGPIASCVITLGCLRVGDIVVAGTEWGKVKVLKDARGQSVKAVGPSSVAEVVGFRSQPSAGQELHVVESDSKAESYTEKFGSRMGSITRIQSSKQEEHEGEFQEVPVIVKADCEGTLEAVLSSLLALPSHEIALKIIDSGTGTVTESDVQSASASGAYIYTFNCRPPGAQLKKMIQNLDVQVMDYRIIYDLVDNVTSMLISKLPPKEELQVVGEATVLQKFEITGKNATVVAGSKVTKGAVKGKCEVKVVRKGQVIHEGKIETLRRGKETADQIMAGNECGITLESFSDFEKGDKIQCFELVVTVRKEL